MLPRPHRAFCWNYAQYRIDANYHHQFLKSGSKIHLHQIESIQELIKSFLRQGESLFEESHLRHLRLKRVLKNQSVYSAYQVAAL